MSLKPAGRAFVQYLVALFAAWIAYVPWLYPHVAGLGETSFGYAACGSAVRLVVWRAPVLLVLAREDCVVPLRALGLLEHWRAAYRPAL